MFPKASDFPYIKILEDNVDNIRSELKSLDPAIFMPWPYYSVKDWSVFGLRFHQKDYPENQALCPKTMAVLNSLPVKVTTAGFSRLGPKGMIAPHEGDTETEWTIHLGLQVPARSFLKSGDQIIEYKDGKCVVFDDLKTHLAWNEHDEVRVTLMIRVLKDNTNFKLRQISDRMLNIMHRLNKRFWKKQHASISANPC